MVLNIHESHGRKGTKLVVPFAIFLFLIICLIIISGLTGRSPEVISITPKTGIPGTELLVKGRYFGKERNGGRVSVSGFSPSTDAYVEWNDTRIRLLIPEDFSSGLLKVITRNGESSEIIPFVNKMEIPLPIIGPINPGEVYISNFIPRRGSVGNIVTISGINFGGEQGESNVYFGWVSGDRNYNESEAIFSNSISASNIDYDYIMWTDNKIAVQVPDGALSGNIFVHTKTGISNAGFFEVQEPVGQKRIHDKRVYQVSYWVEVRAGDAEAGNGLDIWVPGIIESPLQRDVTLISSESGEPNEETNGIMRFSFTNLLPGETRQIKLRYLFKRYAATTKINSREVREYYDVNNTMYKVFTRSSPLVPSSDVKIITLARNIVGKDKNPYIKAQDIYNHVINLLSPIEEGDIPPSDVLAVCDSRKPEGDAFIYSILCTALMRSVGIPARPVAGYLVCSQQESVEHYWVEFYLEDFGWVPVDPLLGDGKTYKGFQRSGSYRNYYFGNLDNSHITVTRGVIPVKQRNPEGRIVNSRRYASLQTIFEESTGNLVSYSAEWSGLEIIGFY
ncbi:MAG: IPT/TIG domain-containing protein [Spirochaetales bacterium]|nr:IPT/TIG domain-containing protein [Spirochaetales bacterium]